MLLTWPAGIHPPHYRPLWAKAETMKKVTLQLNDTLNFNIAGTMFPTSVDEFKPEALAGLLEYGKRKANDVFNSAKGGENPLTPEEVIEKILEWDFGSGGLRVSPLIKAQREIVKGYLTNTGMKSKDATSHSKDPVKGFKMALGLIIAGKRSCGLNNVPGEDIQDAFDTNWPKVEKQAEAIVEATNLGSDLEI